MLYLEEGFLCYIWKGDSYAISGRGFLMLYLERGILMLYLEGGFLSYIWKGDYYAISGSGADAMQYAPIDKNPPLLCLESPPLR